VLDAIMIVYEPFTVAYGLGILDQVLIIDIGAGTIDLCRLRGTLPEAEDQIALDEAGDFVDDNLPK
jgi:rod shape-determining protein MreB